MGPPHAALLLWRRSGVEKGLGQVAATVWRLFWGGGSSQLWLILSLCFHKRLAKRFRSAPQTVSVLLRQPRDIVESYIGFEKSSPLISLLLAVDLLPPCETSILMTHVEMLFYKSSMWLHWLISSVILTLYGRRFTCIVPFYFCFLKPGSSPGARFPTAGSIEQRAADMKQSRGDGVLQLPPIVPM